MLVSSNFRHYSFLQQDMISNTSALQHTPSISNFFSFVFRRAKIMDEWRKRLPGITNCCIWFWWYNSETAHSTEEKLMRHRFIATTSTWNLSIFTDCYSVISISRGGNIYELCSSLIIWLPATVRGKKDNMVSEFIFRVIFEIQCSVNRSGLDWIGVLIAIWILSNLILFIIPDHGSLIFF